MVDFREIMARVTIRDILATAGLHAKRNRIACPIHEGTNKTSFSFTDHNFICFACGVNGGLVNLVECLHECDRTGALRELHRLAGLTWEESARIVKRLPIPRLPREDPLLLDDEYREAASRLEWLNLYGLALDTALRALRRSARDGKVDPAEFYATELQYLYELEELDPEIIEIKVKVNSLKRELRSNEHHTKRCS